MGIIFFIFGFAMLILAFILEGGTPSALIGISPAIIVFGGVIGATGLSTPTDELKAALRAFPIAFSFKSKTSNPEALISYFFEISTKARKDGMLSLESETKKPEIDPFLRFGLELMIDGTHGEVIREVMENEIATMSMRHATRAKVFEAAGGYAPTMGIIGTVMGLVHVLGNLSDPDSLGPLIAAAFLATLYGISSANLIFLPVGSRLKACDEQEVFEKHLITEGILSIHNGDSPSRLKSILATFLDAKFQGKMGAG